jgi:hypothetical protein
MNPDFPIQLAARLRDNPSLFEGMDDSLLGELIFHYHEGELDSEGASKVKELLKSNTKAKAVWKRLEAADRFVATEAGKTWLKQLPDRVLPPAIAPFLPASAPAFFDRLSEWMAASFRALCLQATCSDGKVDEVVNTFPSGSGDPYEAQLVRDAVGRWFLRVFTTDVEAARLTLRLEIEPESPEMKFTAVEPTMFFAEVRLSENMAAALKSGHRPVFRAKK